MSIARRLAGIYNPEDGYKATSTKDYLDQIRGDGALEKNRETFQLKKSLLKLVERMKEERMEMSKNRLPDLTYL